MKKTLVVPLMIFVCFIACGNSPKEWPPKPAIIHLGEHSCAACRMIISQENYGAQLHQRGKPVELFDDYGCLLKYRPTGDSDLYVYVRSAEDGSWIPENQLSYVVSKHISSPMGYGIVAFATREAASRFASGLDDSKIYSISELIPAAQTILNAH